MPSSDGPGRRAARRSTAAAPPRPRARRGAPPARGRARRRRCDPRQMTRTRSRRNAVAIAASSSLCDRTPPRLDRPAGEVGAVVGTVDPQAHAPILGAAPRPAAAARDQQRGRRLRWSPDDVVPRPRRLAVLLAALPCPPATPPVARARRARFVAHVARAASSSSRSGSPPGRPACVVRARIASCGGCAPGATTRSSVPTSRSPAGRGSRCPGRARYYVTASPSCSPGVAECGRATSRTVRVPH